MWLETQVKARSWVEVMDDSPTNRRKGPEEMRSTKPRQQKRINSVIRAEEKCQSCGQSHHISHCKRFLELADVKEREDIIRTNNLCFRCISPGHIARNCTAERKECCLDGSKSSSHHRLLHGTRRSHSRNNENEAVRVNHLHTRRGTSTMLCVVPVTLENTENGKWKMKMENGKTVQTYGLIDKGAEPVIIQQDIADALGLIQRPTGFVLGTPTDTPMTRTTTPTSRSTTRAGRSI